jgi:hypothetical protein
MATNAGRQPQCGVYLLFLFFSFIVYRFGDSHPPESTRIEAAGSLAVVVFLSSFIIPIWSAS